MKKTVKAKIVDFYAIKSFHEIINLSLILICNTIFDSVTYISGKTAYSNITQLYASIANEKNNHILFKKRYVCEKDTPLGSFLRMIIGFYIVLFEYFRTSYKTELFYNYCNVLAFPFLLLLNRFFRKKVVIMFHGELELLLNHPRIFKPSFMYKKIYQWSFRFLVKNSNIKILVLGKSIKKNLIILFPQIKDSLIFINHPIINSRKSNVLIRTKEHVLTIGAIGNLDEKKTLDNMVLVAKTFTDEIVNHKIIFKVIGKNPPNYVDKYDFIKWSGYNWLSREKFEKEIDSLDYILFLYPENSYKLTASGAVLDAIMYAKPIISLKNDFFNEMFKKCKIGFMCSDINEVIDSINIVLNENIETTSSFENSLREIMKEYEITYNSLLLEKQL